MLNEILCSPVIHTGDPLCVCMMESLKKWISGSRMGEWLGWRVHLLEILLIRNQAELRKVPSCKKCVTSTDLKANDVFFF